MKQSYMNDLPNGDQAVILIVREPSFKERRLSNLYAKKRLCFMVPWKVLNWTS